MKLSLATLAFLLSSVAYSADPKFSADNTLEFPADYRDWVHMSSGLGMTYGPNGMPDAPSFDNVYVSPQAWKAFRETGKWPELTMFALEVRFSTSHGSINKGGYFQTDISAVEIAVKDTKRFAEGWAYYDFGGGMRPARAKTTPLGKNAGCNACHSANGAVENTFVQFYPLAIPIAKKFGTLKASYQAPAPSPATFIHAMRESGWKSGQQVLADAKQKDPSAPVLKQSVLNTVGRQLAASGNKAEALEVMRYTAQTYPQSAVAQDSLAELSEDAGDRAAALQAARLTMQLLPGDASLNEDRRQKLQKAAADRIKRLEAMAKQ